MVTVFLLHMLAKRKEEACPIATPQVAGSHSLQLYHAHRALWQAVLLLAWCTQLLSSSSVQPLKELKFINTFFFSLYSIILNKWHLKCYLTESECSSYGDHEQP